MRMNISTEEISQHPRLLQAVLSSDGVTLSAFVSLIKSILIHANTTYLSYSGIYLVVSGDWLQAHPILSQCAEQNKEMRGDNGGYLNLGIWFFDEDLAMLISAVEYASKECDFQFFQICTR